MLQARLSSHCMEGAYIMRIGLTCYSGVGGSGILGTELGKQLALRGHEVHFITSCPPLRLDNFFSENLFVHEAEEMDYPVFKHPPYSLSLAAKMAEIARKVPLDILHVHYAIPHAASAYIAKNMLEGQRLKIITTLHGTDVTLVGSRPAFIPLVRFLIEKSDGVTAVSKYLKDTTYHVFSPKKEIEVIYNFVDTKVFKPNKDESLRLKLCSKDCFILIHISNFRPVKKVLDTIRVFYMVQKEIPACLIMVGDGVDFYAATRLVDSMGIGEKVKFLGKQRFVEKIIPIADLMILNSAKESFGLAVLEAASCGVPAVVTNVGGLPEVVEHEKTGLVIPQNDLEKMAREIINLLKNSTRLKEMSTQARKRAVEKFDVDIIIPHYESLYKKIINSP